MDQCQIEGCENPVFVKARGWCRRHYNRWWKHGDPLTAAYDRSSGTPLQRWWSKVDKDGPIPDYQPDLGPCWVWTKSLDSHGYGQFDVITEGTHVNHRAHRWGYEHLVRELDDAELLDHLCRVHACVRPDHLEPVTHAVNVARGMAGSHNSSKTHCKNGHEFTPENTITNHKPGWRACRACAQATGAERTARYRARKRAAAKEALPPN